MTTEFTKYQLNHRPGNSGKNTSAELDLRSNCNALCEHCRPCLAIILILLSLATGASAQITPYDLNWHTIDTGGGVSSGGQFTLTSAIGQPDAANSMTGGQFTLTGGFLHERSAASKIREWTLY